MLSRGRHLSLLSTLLSSRMASEPATTESLILGGRELPMLAFQQRLNFYMWVLRKGWLIWAFLVAQASIEPPVAGRTLQGGCPLGRRGAAEVMGSQGHLCSSDLPSTSTRGARLRALARGSFASIQETQPVLRSRDFEDLKDILECQLI